MSSLFRAQRLERRAHIVLYADLDDTFRVQLFLYVRLVELIAYRLLSALASYVQLCFGWDATTTGLCIGTTLLPAEDDKTSSFNKLSGAAHIGELPERQDLRSSLAGGGQALRFVKDPKLACCSPLWEVEELINVLLTMMHPTAPHTSPVGAGTGAGVTIDRRVRAARAPRSLRVLAQHAFAMAAEVQVVGASWDALGASPDPAWRSPCSSAEIPEYNSAEFISGLWRIGTTLITFLRALADTGSAHAKQTADKLEAYKEQRVRWMMSQPTQVAA